MKKVHCLMSQLSLCLCLVMACVLQAQDIHGPVKVYTSDITGKIKSKIGGVSFGGGGAHSYLKKDIAEELKDFPLPLARLEAVPGSYLDLYDPETGKYDWREMDAEIEILQRHGAEIIVNIYYTPKWLSSAPADSGTPYLYYPPTDMEKWCKLVEDIVRHVNHDKKYGIKYWEIWNEPSGNHFWKDAWRPVNKFWDMYVQTYKAIKRADPTAQVGGLADNVAYPVNFEGLFANALSNGVSVDFLTGHWYAEWQDGAWKSPSLYADYCNNITKLYHKYFRKTVPYFWTEWNLQAEENRFEMDQQVAFMAQSLFYMQNSPADGSCFFRVEDYPAKASILDANRKMKTPGHVLKMWSMLHDHIARVSSVPKDMTVIATVDPETRNVQIMIARYDVTPKAASRPMNMMMADSKEYNFSYRLIDHRSAKKIGHMAPAIPLESKNQIISLDMAPYSVCLITAEPVK